MPDFSDLRKKSSNQSKFSLNIRVKKEAYIRSLIQKNFIRTHMCVFAREAIFIHQRVDYLCKDLIYRDLHRKQNGCLSDRDRVKTWKKR